MQKRSKWVENYLSGTCRAKSVAAKVAIDVPDEVAAKRVDEAVKCTRGCSAVLSNLAKSYEEAFFITTAIHCLYKVNRHAYHNNYAIINGDYCENDIISKTALKHHNNNHFTPETCYVGRSLPKLTESIKKSFSFEYV